MCNMLPAHDAGPMQEVEFMGVSAAFFAAHDLWMT